jgi:hypothetical protein
MKIAAALVVACAAASAAQADLIAYWNFNDNVTGTNNGDTYAPTTGAGLIQLAVPSQDQAGNNRGINSFAGSIINAIVPDIAGQSLAVQASSAESGAAPFPNNGATLTISFSMAGFEDVFLTFATQRTNTGFNNNQVAYSTDGTNYTNLGAAYNPATGFSLQTFDFSGLLDNAATAFIRITLDGATNVGGNNRFDNFQLNATLVPAPGALALVGLGGLLVARRRRA